MNYIYAYFIWAVIFGIIWISLYFWRKDVRKEMLIVSIFMGFIGILTEIIHIQDWWQPLTITRSTIGIEDFLIGFFIGGIAAIIYEEIYKKKINTRKKFDIKNPKIWKLLALFCIIFATSFYVIKLHSFYAISISTITLIIIILSLRKDLIKDSLASGLLLMITGTAVYKILQIIFPQVIQKFWFLPNTWYSALIFGIPIAEYIWFFLAGASIGPIYEYWQEAKLVNKK